MERSASGLTGPATQRLLRAVGLAAGVVLAWLLLGTGTAQAAGADPADDGSTAGLAKPLSAVPAGVVDDVVPEEPVPGVPEGVGKPVAAAIEKPLVEATEESAEVVAVVHDATRTTAKSVQRATTGVTSAVTDTVSTTVTTVVQTTKKTVRQVTGTVRPTAAVVNPPRPVVERPDRERPTRVAKRERSNLSGDRHLERTARDTPVTQPGRFAVVSDADLHPVVITAAATAVQQSDVDDTTPAGARPVPADPTVLKAGVPGAHACPTSGSSSHGGGASTAPIQEPLPTGGLLAHASPPMAESPRRNPAFEPGCTPD